MFHSKRSNTLPFLKLFFVDVGAPEFPHSTDDDVLKVSAERSRDSDDVEDDDAQSEASNDADKLEVEPLPASLAPPASRPPNHKSRKAPAWTDPDDASLEVSLASSTRLRKLRDAPEEDAINGREYERRLRRQFVKMNPTPEWATSAARRKRRRTDSGAGGDDVEGLDMDTLVTSSGGILDHRRRTRLDPGVLSIERLRDANQAAQAEGEINAIQFHPSPQVSMLLIASSDRRIRLFNVRAYSSAPASPASFPTWH